MGVEGPYKFTGRYQHYQHLSFITTFVIIFFQAFEPSRDRRNYYRRIRRRYLACHWRCDLLALKP